MKKLILIISILIPAVSAFAGPLTPYVGVWANDSCEAVVTERALIFYQYIAPNHMTAILSIPEENYKHQTTFEGDSLSFNQDVSLNVSLKDKRLSINGRILTLVENLEIVPEYAPTKCDGKFNVGRCLQEWRLGSDISINNGAPAVEINTNRHMFVYALFPQMVYIRAAATRNNNKGTVFFQNIRMMKNLNTGEYTAHLHPWHKQLTKDDLLIDDSKFNPNACAFCPDGDIYWSVIDASPDTIHLNGCGETYTVSPNPNLAEWFKYKEY